MPTTRTPVRRATRTAAAAAGLLLLAGGLAGCSDDGEAASDEQTPEEVMELARTTLDETSGVRIELATDDLPDGVTALRSAEGVGVHPAAFDGTITVVLGGTDFNVPVIAVDGTVYAQIPLTSGWSDVDPAEYGAPDPAQLMSTEEGISSLLTDAEELVAGESVRGGEDNREVLTEYAGVLSGPEVQRIIPSADAESDFAATFLVTDDGELRQADLTGVFYPGTESMTYTLTFEGYGTEQDITAP